jgi:hypothetical protein
VKRLSKQQREGQQRAALLRRVTDVYSGAMGGEWDSDQFATAEILSRVIPALKELFSDQWHEYLCSPHMLHYFDTAKNATDRLFYEGIRA